jgi:hypothetical protein
MEATMSEMKSAMNAIIGCALFIGPVFLVLALVFSGPIADPFASMFVLWVLASVAIGLTVYFKNR